MKKPRKLINCEYCKIEIEVPVHYDRKFCSKLCANRAHSELSRIRANSDKNPFRHKCWNKGLKYSQPKTQGEKHYNWKGGRNRRGRPAGFQIGNKTKSQFKKGSEHPNYIDGRKCLHPEYPEEFNTKLKQKIFKRDNYCCQWYDETDSCYGKLAVHHIDYNKKNNVEKNLTILCNKHNAKANFKRQFHQDIFNKLTSIKYVRYIERNRGGEGL